MRLFFALWPPPEAARALADWARSLEGRAIPAQKIHLTLAFLGEAAPEKAGAAGRRVQGRAHGLPIEVAKYWKHNKIVWAGPRETPARMKAMVEALHFELFRAEYILERRPFAAHVTLVRNARPPRSLPALPEVDWPVQEFVLVRSSVDSKGSTYQILERFPLG
ncbi:MAG: 2'-5' RNA ligase [Betaproteobacteria bacterium RIFCSPLOWO2_12_FULL_65_14]|nr:MAG: 2'-5' RNA ligase [Betaproteobacteria bacterium RIFCSPLOWO2_12_FULL_65_14]